MSAHVVSRAALAVVVQVVLCFLKNVVQIQRSLKAAQKGTLILYQYDRKQTATLVMLLNGLMAHTYLPVNWMSCASSRHCSRDSLFSSRMAAQMKSSKVKSVLMACSSDSELSSAKKKQRLFKLIFNRNKKSCSPTR